MYHKYALLLRIRCLLPVSVNICWVRENERKAVDSGVSCDVFNRFLDLFYNRNWNIREIIGTKFDRINNYRFSK